MNQIRNSKSVHTMNRHVSQLAAHVATVCDIDCIYRNHVQEFWCMFEWKKDSERMGANGTQQMLHEIDQAFNTASSRSDAAYVGLFIVRLGFDYDTFPLDDTQQCEILHLCGGYVEGEKTYTTGARSAIEHILKHGKLL